MMTVAAIVPAAGAGRRFGGRLAKPLVDLDGAPLLVQTLRVLQRSPSIRWIIPVVGARHRSVVRQLLRRHGITKALAPVAGGASRAESVARGFAAMPRAARWILIHDAARPCVSEPLIASVVRGARRWGAAACGLPASVTVKAAEADGTVRLTLDREQLWFMQTPQAFRREWMAQALKAVGRRNGLSEYPDDASIVEAAGFPVRIVPGDPWNLKVTTRKDLVLAETILKARAVGSEDRRQKSEVRKGTK